MSGLLPLAIVVAMTIICQSVGVAGAMAVEALWGGWAGLAAFGISYLGMFAVAWRLTVLIVDRHLIPKGYLDGTGQRMGPRAGGLAPSHRR